MSATQSLLGPVMGCVADPCAENTWPDEDWLVIETPVGLFEVLMCEVHYARFQAGAYDPTDGSWVRAIELVNLYPVMHGA